jgi:acyl-CoA reductase-like NAD-dependent aldehyde dehydrogenase
MTEHTHIINGKPATSPTTLDVINPATQKKIAEVPVATKEQVRRFAVTGTFDVKLYLLNCSVF